MKSKNQRQNLSSLHADKKFVPQTLPMSCTSKKFRGMRYYGVDFYPALPR